MTMPTANLQVVNAPLDPSQLGWYKDFRRPITEILADLSKPIPSRYLAQRKQGGAVLVYLPWYNAVKLLDRCAPGWDYSITQIHTTSDASEAGLPLRARIFVSVRIVIRAAEGDFAREATGTELLNCGSYGDPSSNCESMALRRAAAKYGLGLYLYDKD